MNISELARQIIGVQPMTGPAAQIFALNARFSEHYCHSASCDTARDNFGAIFPHVVDIPRLQVLKNDTDVMIWAIKEIRHPYNYCRARLGHTLILDTEGEHGRLSRGEAISVWRWSFADGNDAMAFKLRWL